jgi:hypothetical protein
MQFGDLPGRSRGGLGCETAESVAGLRTRSDSRRLGQASEPLRRARSSTGELWAILRQGGLRRASEP